MEIERKFLLNFEDLPKDLDIYPCKKIIQGYISHDPVVRIRKYGEKFFITIKGKGRMVREEYEMEITQKQFENLLKKVETNIIKKNRYLIPIENNLVAELDIYFEDLAGFYTVEVEFENEDDAHAFKPPIWFSKDVTSEGKYSNSSIAKNGLT